MSSAAHPRPSRAAAPNRQKLIQIPVRFSAEFAERIAVVAAERSTTPSRVIGDAVEQLVVAGAELIDLDHSPGTSAQAGHRIRVYIPRDLADALDSLCRVADMSRAEVVAFAVHRAFVRHGGQEQSPMRSPEEPASP